MSHLLHLMFEFSFFQKIVHIYKYIYVCLMYFVRQAWVWHCEGVAVDSNVAAAPGHGGIALGSCSVLIDHCS